MFKKLLLSVGLALLLSGCGPSRLLHIGNNVVNMGQPLPDDMVNRHVSGMVAFDETWAGNYGRIARNALYVQGVVEGTPEYQLRVARINLSNTGENFFWKKGELLFQGAAIVPDHLPQLRAGDLVEIRQTGTWRTVEDFFIRKEGNVVVRILCQKASAGYQKCLEKGPLTGIAKGVGETKTPYPPSVSSYGYQFSAWYSVEGRPLRPLPR